MENGMKKLMMVLLLLSGTGMQDLEAAAASEKRKRPSGYAYRSAKQVRLMATGAAAVEGGSESDSEPDDVLVVPEAEVVPVGTAVVIVDGFIGMGTLRARTSDNDVLLGADVYPTAHDVRKFVFQGAGLKLGDVKVDTERLRVVCRKHRANRLDTQGRIPLHYAAFMGDIAACKELIADGACVTNHDSLGRTIVHDAIHPHNAVEMVGYFVNLKNADGSFVVADVNVRDDDGKTPLHLAAENEKPEVMAILLRRGADVLAQDKTGKTPLHYAAQGWCVDRVIPMIGTLIAFCLGQDQFAFVNKQDEHGDTALHLAVRYGVPSSDKIVQKLLVLGADKHLKNTCGTSALSEAELIRRIKI